MADGRMLKKKISKSRKLPKLPTDSDRLFYTWLIPHLDVEGRILADPDVLKGEIVPRLKDWTPKKVEETLLQLSKHKLIILYNADGDRYLELLRFGDEQSLRKDRERKSEIPGPDEGEIINNVNDLDELPGKLPSNSSLTPAQVKLREVKLSKDKVRQNACAVIHFLNEIGKRNFTTSNANLENIGARLNEGHTVEECKQVILNKWKDTNFDKKYFRPQTLFKPSKFEGYLNEKSVEISNTKNVVDWTNTGEERVDPRLEKLVKGAVKKG